MVDQSNSMMANSSRRRLLALIIVVFAIVSVIQLNEISSKVNEIEDDDEFGDAFIRVHRENLRRLEQVRRTCQHHRHKAWANKPLWKTWMVASQKHRLLMCRHAKAGSTTWLWHLLRLSSHLGPDSSNVSVDNVHRKWLKYITLDAFDRKFNQDVLEHKDIFAFSFVRHPFQRLESAFQDKIVARRDPYYHGLAMKLQAEQEHSNRSLFEHFLQYVLKDGNDKDVHWRSFQHTCAYCTYPFDFIGKQETFTEDTAYVLHMVGDEPEQVRTRSNVHCHSSVNRSRTKALFDSVSNHVKAQLVQMYQIDLEMFNYSIHEYI